MDPMEEHSIEWNRNLLDGLLDGCPMGEAMDDCPARQLRTIPAEKRMITVQATMTPEQVEEVIVHHRQCLTKRLGDLPPL